MDQVWILYNYVCGEGSCYLVPMFDFDTLSACRDVLSHFKSLYNHATFFCVANQPI